MDYTEQLTKYGLIIGASLLAYFAVIILFVFYIICCWRLPAKGQKRKLPNGMQIQEWTSFETDILYKEIWGDDNAYAKGGIEFKPNSLIIDAGANIGMFTLFAAKQCQGQATILSFEPIPTTYQVLQANANTANNGGYQIIFNPSGSSSSSSSLSGAKNTGNNNNTHSLHILPFNVGLTDKPTEVIFEHHPNLSIWSTADNQLATGRITRITEDFVRGARASSNPLVWIIPTFLLRTLIHMILVRRFAVTIPVPATLVRLTEVLDQYAPNGTIDLLKVDVEGAEIMVLNGITDNHWSRIRQVVMEVENFTILKTITNILQSKGFTVSSVASEREKNPAAISEVSMVYAVRKESTGKGVSNGTSSTVTNKISVPIPIPGAADDIIHLVQKMYGGKSSSGSGSVVTNTTNGDNDEVEPPVSESTKSTSRKRVNRKD